MDFSETSEMLPPRPVGDAVPGTEPGKPSLTNRPVLSIGDNISTTTGLCNYGTVKGAVWCQQRREYFLAQGAFQGGFIEA